MVGRSALGLAAAALLCLSSIADTRPENVASTAAGTIRGEVEGNLRILCGILTPQRPSETFSGATIPSEDAAMELAASPKVITGLRREKLDILDRVHGQTRGTR